LFTRELAASSEVQRHTGNSQNLKMHHWIEASAANHQAHLNKNSMDNSGIVPSIMRRQQGAMWQQGPAGPALVLRRDTLSCHEINLHDCSSWYWERSIFTKNIDWPEILAKVKISFEA
jgi:hypothetical protein